MFVNERFELKHRLNGSPKWGYDGFGEVVFYRTYSRIKPDGFNENWNECITRVINGTFSIRKDWYIKNKIKWDEEYWQDFAAKMAESAFNMEWLPPGRGLWMMGTDFIYERGSMGLYNCGYTDLTNDNFYDDICWAMDALMLGVGIGGGITPGFIRAELPSKKKYVHVVEDSREGWVDVIKAVIKSYTHGGKTPKVDISNVRGPGKPIKGFGGYSSGPKPLLEFIDFIHESFQRYCKDSRYSATMLKADILNATGRCVVAGNVRRSAEILLGDAYDDDFYELKNYENPEFSYRSNIGWLSNNTVKLSNNQSFDNLGKIAYCVKTRGEPGYANIMNFPKGRLKDDIDYDKAVGLNPCGEITLEHRELCNVDETFPTMNPDSWNEALVYATTYCSTVSLLPTHQESSNRVIARNRRIGVGIVDFTGWIHNEGVNKVVPKLKQGYNIVRNTNNRLNDEAGVPRAIKLTTIKPGGTVPKLAGKTPGAGYPTHKYTLRRIRIAANNPICEKLVNVPNEQDIHDPNTLIYEFPVLQGPAKPADEVSAWEQAMNLIMLQREWADNAVSNTIYFQPKWIWFKTIDEYILSYKHHIPEVQECINNVLLGDGSYETKDYKCNGVYDFEGELVALKLYKLNPRSEEDTLNNLLASVAPHTKSMSLCPHSNEVYPQLPEEGITVEEYEKRKSLMPALDFSDLRYSETVESKYCDATGCTI